jgi:acyl-CoA hydrolase
MPPFPIHDKTVLIRPEFLNQFGGLFGGYMLQWADEMAFNAASLQFPAASFVTRRFEAFDFVAPVRNGDIIKISSQVLRTGVTSCVVAVWCCDAYTQSPVFRTTAVLVSVDLSGKKTPIPLA